MKCKALLQSNCEISLPHCIPILFNVFFPDNKSFLSLWIIPSESIVSFSHFASCFLLVASCSLCLAGLLVLQNFVLSLSHLHPLSLSVFCWPSSVLYCVVFCILSSLLTLFCIVLYCILFFVLPVDPLLYCTVLYSVFCPPCWPGLFLLDPLSLTLRSAVTDTLAKKETCSVGATKVDVLPPRHSDKKAANAGFFLYT